MSSSTNNARGFDGGGEFHKLGLGTQLYVERVYSTMLKLVPRNDSKSSYLRLRRALRCVGVLPECNLEDRSTPEILIAQSVHQQWKDAKLYTSYSDKRFPLSTLTKEAYRCHWNLGDLKIIAAKWMRGKNADLLLTLKTLGQKLLAKYETNYYDSKLRQNTSQGSLPAATYMAEWTARNYEASSQGQRGEMAAVAEEPIVETETKPTNNSAKLYMDDETLRLIESVRHAHEAVERGTAKLVAHLLKSAQKDEPSRIPPHMRIEAAHTIDYPWRNTRSERGPRRRGRQS